MNNKVEIAKAIALLTAEYDLPAFGPERIQMWMEALAAYPAGSITKSVTNYIKTNRFKPQLADIVEGCAKQLGEFWLGAEEAWGMMPKDESTSAMMTAESAEALAAAQPLIEKVDYTAARMTFKEAYTRLVDKAKLEGRMPAYYTSFGTDPVGRSTMLVNAVNKGQITVDEAVKALPENADGILRMCGTRDHPLLAGPSSEDRKRLKEVLATLRLGQ